MKILEWTEFSSSGEAWHVASYHQECDYHEELHTHDFAEIFWIREGSGYQIGENERQRLEQGDLCLVNPEVIHLFGTPTRMTLVNVSFPAKTFALLQQVYTSLQLTNQSSLPLPIRVSENGLVELNRALNELVACPPESIYLWRFLARCMCVLESREEGIPTNAPGWLKRACQGIREPAHAKSGVEGFVRLARRSPEHVSRFTRKWTGKTPRDLVLDARLKLMAQELALTDKPILEIALDLGFENLGHCYKCFKHAYGQPPGAYRTSQKALPAGIPCYGQ